MLSLSASHLRALRVSSSNKRLVWVDIGGGTGISLPVHSPSMTLNRTIGHNVERMHKYFPISSFDAVYVVDLCEPLLQVARKRFADRGWTNVTVLCQDASQFYLPEWSDGRDPKGCVSFVTLSYSLSMVCPFALRFHNRLTIYSDS